MPYQKENRRSCSAPGHQLGRNSLTMICKVDVTADAKDV